MKAEDVGGERRFRTSVHFWGHVLLGSNLSLSERDDEAC